MGRLVYGVTAYELSDRLLAHLQVVVSTKLRRGENFFVSWRDPGSAGSGRQAIWVDNGVHLAFEYDGGSFPQVSREWVEALSASAATGMGLQLTDEHGELINTPHHPDG
jgi:hypothetical protein